MAAECPPPLGIVPYLYTCSTILTPLRYLIYLQIRKQLKEMGVDMAAECLGCNEKRQFVEVLCKHGGA